MSALIYTNALRCSKKSKPWKHKFDEKGPTFLSCPQRPCVISVVRLNIAMIVVLTGCETQHGFEPVGVIEPRMLVDVTLMPRDPSQGRGPAE